MRGVRTAKVRDFVWREHHGVGVGHYAAGDFLHVDSRPDERHRLVGPREDSRAAKYDPRWAKRARRARGRCAAASAPVASLAVR